MQYLNNVKLGIFLGTSTKRTKPKTQTEQPTFDYQNGFWLDNNTFIKADNAEIKLTQRKDGGVYGQTKEASMVIFTNAVEILVNDDDKIVGVTSYPKFGLWLDAIVNALETIQKNPPVSKVSKNS